MRRSLGFSMLGLGLALAASLYPPSGAEPRVLVMTPVRDVSLPSHDVMPSRLAAFSPGPVLARAAQGEAPQQTYLIAFLSGKAAAMAAEPQRIPVPDSAGEMTPWRTSLVVRERAPRAPSATALAAEIQSELKRVGCYSGAIDGRWGAASRAALVAFMDRVNAVLPTDKPDFVLLTLARAQPAGTCGSNCPGSQQLNEAGRCVPRAILAQNSRQRPELPRSAAGPVSQGAVVAALGPQQEASSSALSDLFPGRMAVGASELIIEGSAPRAEETSARMPEPKIAISRPTVPGVTKAKTSRSAPKRYDSSYRMVRHLFENPLGRM